MTDMAIRDETLAVGTGATRAMAWTGDDVRAAAAARLVLLAGRIVGDHFREGVEASWKLDGSTVTDADVDVQAWLERQIREQFPGDDVLGEEAGHDQESWTARHCWVLDPIDGTNNFARGLPGFCVSIGVMRDRRPFAGAVYDPVADWLFTAQIGAGAWLNGRPIRTTSAPLTGRSLFSLRAPFDGGLPPFVGDWLQRFRLRRFGSTALSLCYVALGGLAFVHDHKASLWDIAGAAPVLLEAGGVITTSDGGSLFPWPATELDTPMPVLAGDPWSHREVLAEIAGNAAPVTR